MLHKEAAALLLLLVLVDHAEMFRVAIGPVIGISSTSLVVGIAWAWLVMMGAAIGFSVWRPRWAIPLVVLLVPISTVFLGISFLPFVLLIVPPTLRLYVLVPANIAVLLLMVFWLRRPAESRVMPAG